MKNILVIKLGALGDFVICFGPFAAIRDHHRDARIHLLTTAPYAELARRSGYFDDVIVARRAKPWQLVDWLRLVMQLRALRLTRVYDFQRKTRTRILYRALSLGRRLEWSGVIPGCSHYIPDPPDDHRHILAKFADQLARAGIAAIPPPDLSWFGANLDVSLPAGRFAVLVPGSSPQWAEKRAPVRVFASAARKLLSCAITPVLVGTAADRDRVAEIVDAVPGAIDYCGKTTIETLALLGRHATLALGNDTGPMHVLSAVGCPVIVLFNERVRPERVKPIGPSVTVIVRSDLDLIADVEVVTAIDTLIASGTGPSVQARERST